MNNLQKEQIREIRFRAWFKPLKRMYVVREMKFNRDGSIIVITNHTGGTAPNSYWIMQFTGLKDKNKKEIFEGDIVKFKFTDCEKDKGKYIIAEVCWIDNGWGLKEGENTYAVEDEDFEKIGNIYENPELLEEK